MQVSYDFHNFYFTGLNEKLKLMEEKNDMLSKQIQEYQSKAEDSFKIVQEKQKLVSIFVISTEFISDKCFINLGTRHCVFTCYRGKFFHAITKIKRRIESEGKRIV